MTPDALIIGVDPSLTAMGVAGDAGIAVVRCPHKGMRRLAYLRDALLSVKADLVVIEGYSFGSRNSQAHALGELGGVLRLAMWDAQVPYVDLPPATLKTWATGKGNASKELVLTEAVRRLGYTGSSTDEADALWAYHAGLEMYGRGLVAMPAHNRSALRKISWPGLAEAVAS